jgi:hypothetical protein
LDLQQKRWTYKENGGLTRKKVDLQRNDPPYRPEKWTYRPEKCPYSAFLFQFETKQQENWTPKPDFRLKMPAFNTFKWLLRIVRAFLKRGAPVSPPYRTGLVVLPELLSRIKTMA